jgi:hypothetical protein
LSGDISLDKGPEIRISRLEVGQYQSFSNDVTEGDGTVPWAFFLRKPRQSLATAPTSLSRCALNLSIVRLKHPAFRARRCDRKPAGFP